MFRDAQEPSAEELLVPHNACDYPYLIKAMLFFPAPMPYRNGDISISRSTTRRQVNTQGRKYVLQKHPFGASAGVLGLALAAVLKKVRAQSRKL